ncbi:MAG: hydrolase [Spartobacteria bacterium Tous-C9RFEB]|nr:MAG: hydrolase [Spartobacteria bacterium Tous-C9RFEB]
MDRRLFLFDIDGTLITSGGAGEAALKDAMRSRFDVEEDLDGIILAGATDARIARELLEKHSIAVSAENVAALLDTYLGHLNERIGRHDGKLLPGIVPLLKVLSERSDAVLALLTGNVIRGAEIKLTHYGVWDFFEFGAFADDHHDRNELGKFARARALERHGEEFPPSRIYVIGDTPKDIECGRAIGARTVAIATGHYSSDQLRDHAPDFLFEDLSDTGRVVALLFGE